LYRLTQSGDNLDEIGKSYRQSQQNLIPSGGGSDDAAKAATVQDLTTNADNVPLVAVDSHGNYVEVPIPESFQYYDDLPPFRYGASTNPVIAETQLGSGRFTSQYTLSQDEALEAGIQWLGPDRIVNAERGVYRSITPNPDGTFNQFRVDSDSLAGNHSPNIPHVHFEIIQVTPRGEKSIVNNHVPIK
jgi:hypothetical protein